MCNFEAVEPCRLVCFDYAQVQKLMLEASSLSQIYIGILEETLRVKLDRDGLINGKRHGTLCENEG